jgi:hypothetical protein
MPQCQLVNGRTERMRQIMQAKPWEWIPRREPQWWEKTITLAVNCTEPIVRLLKIPGAYVPGADKVLDQVLEFVSPYEALYAADLDISPLEPIEFTPLAGVPPPVTSKSGEGPVFFDGVHMMMTVLHNGKGKEKITLERIELSVKCRLGADTYFSYHRDGEAIIGAGFVEPLRFFVELEAKGPRPARRQVTSADGKKTMLIARGPNFLDTDPSSVYEFSPNEQQKINFSLTAIDAGYYEAALAFFYRVAARELRQQNRGKIYIYTDGA